MEIQETEKEVTKALDRALGDKGTPKSEITILIEKI